MAERFSREPETLSECYHSEPINPFRELNLTIQPCIDPSMRSMSFEIYHISNKHNLKEKNHQKTAVQRPYRLPYNDCFTPCFELYGASQVSPLSEPLNQH